MEMLELAEKKNFGKPHPLTKDEAMALFLYTLEFPNGLYKPLNAALRSTDRKQIVPYMPLLKLMMGMKKLPSYVGRVHRGINGDSLDNHYKVGQKITWWSFTSTTTDKNMLNSERFLGTEGNRTLFDIQVLKGVDISRYSSYAEQEKVLMPGSQFQVKSCLAVGNGLVLVELVETKSELVI